jgi:hypothetical protein
MGKEKLSWARIVLVVAALGLSACAATVQGNSAGGIARVSLMQSEAFKAANAHCEKFGKIARISGNNDFEGTMTFDCVAP